MTNLSWGKTVSRNIISQKSVLWFAFNQQVRDRSSLALTWLYYTGLWDQSQKHASWVGGQNQNVWYLNATSALFSSEDFQIRSLNLKLYTTTQRSFYIYRISLRNLIAHLFQPRSLFPMSSIKHRGFFCLLQQIKIAAITLCNMCFMTPCFFPAHSPRLSCIWSKRNPLKSNRSPKGSSS